MCYRIVAVSPEGDACCRLVDACSGELTVVNLWDILRSGFGNSNDGQQEDEGEHMDDDDESAIAAAEPAAPKP